MTCADQLLSSASTAVVDLPIERAGGPDGRRLCMHLRLTVGAPGSTADLFRRTRQAHYHGWVVCGARKSVGQKCANGSTFAIVTGRGLALSSNRLTQIDDQIRAHWIRTHGAVQPPVRRDFSCEIPQRIDLRYIRRARTASNGVTPATTSTPISVAAALTEGA